MPSLITIEDSLNGNPAKALAVYQEVYDDIADRMGEHVEIEYRTIFDDFGPEQHFTIVPVSTTLIVISNHIYNITHNLTFEEFFLENFDLAEWFHKEILLHEDEIPLTATQFRDGLWDNTWSNELEEECHDDECEVQVNNPLYLNTGQLENYRLVT